MRFRFQCIPHANQYIYITSSSCRTHVFRNVTIVRTVSSLQYQLTDCEWYTMNVNLFHDYVADKQTTFQLTHAGSYVYLNPMCNHIHDTKIIKCKNWISVLLLVITNLGIFIKVSKRHRQSLVSLSICVALSVWVCVCVQFTVIVSLVNLNFNWIVYEHKVDSVKSLPQRTVLCYRFLCIFRCINWWWRRNRFSTATNVISWMIVLTWQIAMNISSCSEKKNGNWFI